MKLVFYKVQYSYFLSYVGHCAHKTKLWFSSGRKDQSLDCSGSICGEKETTWSKPTKYQKFPDIMGENGRAPYNQETAAAVHSGSVLL